jgi:feruloyl-CoA synthase
VSLGPLRARFVAHFAPYVQDVVIAGHDRDYLGALVFPTAEGRELKDANKVFRELLQSFAATSTGNSNRIVTAIVMEEPASIDLGEITDKGTINQRAVLDNRRNLVEELYHPASRTIVL